MANLAVYPPNATPEQQLLIAAKNVIWKLARNEMFNGDCIPAGVTRTDITIKMLAAAIEKLESQAS